MGQQDFKVIGKRDENDTLEDITLTRSILLNDLTQTQLKRLYRRGTVLWAYFFYGVKLLYKCTWKEGEIILTVERVHFDMTNGNVVFECGYSLDFDKYFEVLLYKSTDGRYVLSPRILDTEWLKESDLKTINGESIVGDGNITVGGGGAAAYVYFRLENSSSISDWNDNLGECGIYMEGFLDSNEALTTTLSCYCKVQENNTYQLVPFSIRRDENGDFHIYLTAYCYSEWRRYDISASSWENLRYSPTINYTTIN